MSGVSRESRAVLDHVFVEFAVSIPSKLKTNGLAGKRILKAAIRDLLPASIIDRKKMAFPSPWKGCLNGPLFPKIEELLLLSPRRTERGSRRTREVPDGDRKKITYAEKNSFPENQSGKIYSER